MAYIVAFPDRVIMVTDRPYCHGGPKSFPLQTIPVTHLVIRDLYDLNGLSK